MNAKELLDVYFLDARCKLIEVAAFLDRIERSPGKPDFRLTALRTAMKELEKPGADRARRVLEALSDPTSDPIPIAHTKGACGAWNEKG